MRIALLLQFIERSIEWQPLADARGELAFLLQFLVNLKTLPTGIVLRRGDAMFRQVGQRDLDAATPIFMGRSGDHSQNSALRRIAQYAGRFSIFVAVDLAALRVAA